MAKILALFGFILIFSVIALTEAGKLDKAQESEEEYGYCPSEIEVKCPEKCCGTLDNRCCSKDEFFNQFPSLNTDVQAQPRSIIRGLFKLVAAIVGALIFCIIVICVCCFCCPFCLFSKHRRGSIIQRNDQQQPAVVQPQPGVQAVPMQPPPPAGYPTQPPPTGYPPQPAYGYPPPPQTGYPENPPPYPGPPLENQPLNQQAPPLESKDAYNRQPAYNPNM